MSDEKPKAAVTYGPPLPPDDPQFRKAIEGGLKDMWSVQEKINRYLAAKGLTINDVGCVVYNPETGEITIHDSYSGP